MKTITVIEAGKLLKLHPNSVRRMSINHEIPGKKVANKWLYIEEDLQNWLRGDNQKQSITKVKRKSPNFSNSDYF